MDASSNKIEFDDRLTAVIKELQIERRRTADELEALQTFEEEIRSIPTEEIDHDLGQPVAVEATPAESTTGLQRIREAYESTLMSVPHYLEEYDDTYTESLSGEFSPEIAAVLTDSTGFNDRCKRAVVSAVSNAQSTRESLLDTIDREEDSVRETKVELVSLVEECEEIRLVQFNKKGFGTLDAHRTRLQTMAERCRVLSDRRQEAIFDQRWIQRLPADVPDVTMYFYQDLAVDYPIMSIIAELLDAITKCQSRVEQAMTYCHA